MNPQCSHFSICPLNRVIAVKCKQRVSTKYVHQNQFWNKPNSNNFRPNASQYCCANMILHKSNAETAYLTKVTLWRGQRVMVGWSQKQTKLAESARFLGYTTKARAASIDSLLSVLSLIGQKIQKMHFLPVLELMSDSLIFLLHSHENQFKSIW